MAGGEVGGGDMAGGGSGRGTVNERGEGCV